MIRSAQTSSDDFEKSNLWMPNGSNVGGRNE